MGGTKESATEAPEKYKLDKPMTSGIVNIHLSPSERSLTSQQSSPIIQKEQGWVGRGGVGQGGVGRGGVGRGRAGQGPHYYVMTGYLDT